MSRKIKYDSNISLGPNGRANSMQLPSLSHFRPSIIWPLALYIVIYSVPNIFGMTSVEQPGLFAMWQAVSLSTILAAGALLMVLQRTLSAQRLLYFALIVLSAILTTFITMQDLELSKILTALVPVLVVFVFYVLCGNARLDTDEFNKLSLYFVAFITFALIYNLIVNASSIPYFMSIGGPYEYNLQSFFENRNAFAYLLSLGIALVVYLRTANKLKVFTFATLLTMMAGSLFITLSRGGILFGAVSILLFYLYCGKPKNIVLYVIILCTIVLSSLSYFGEGFIQDNLIRSDSGLTRRDSIQNDGVAYYLSHDTILGSGESIRPYLRKDYEVSSLHNTYLDLLVTGGLLRFSVYILIAAFVAKNIWAIRKVDRAIGSILLALFTTYLLYSSVETATPFLLSPSSAATTVFVFIVPMYLRNYFKPYGDVRINGGSKHVNV